APTWSIGLPCFFPSVNRIRLQSSLMRRLRECGERSIWTTTRLRRSPICRNWWVETCPSQNRARRRRKPTNRTPMMTHLSCRVSPKNVVGPRYAQSSAVAGVSGKDRTGDRRNLEKQVDIHEHQKDQER